MLCVLPAFSFPLSQLSSLHTVCRAADLCRKELSRRVLCPVPMLLQCEFMKEIELSACSSKYLEFFISS